MPSAPRGAGSAARLKHSGRPPCREPRTSPVVAWPLGEPGLGRSQCGVLELVGVWGSKKQRRADPVPRRQQLAQEAARSTGVWGRSLQLAGPLSPAFALGVVLVPSLLSDVHGMPAFLAARTTNCDEALFDSFCFVLCFFFHPLVPRSTLLRQKIIAIISANLLSLSKRCNGAAQAKPQASLEQPPRHPRAAVGI